MNDHRFNELLNLYIDQQIAPADAAELESELQASSQRRESYRQYCRMHRATKLVYESFRQHAGACDISHPGKLASVDKFTGRRPAGQLRWAYVGGAVAAAVCLALLVSRINFSRSAAGMEVVTVTPHQPEQQALTASPMRAAPVGATHPGLVSWRDGLNVGTDYSAILTALRGDERSVAGGQLSTSRLQPLFDDGVFDSRQLLPSNSHRIYRSRNTAPQQQPAEFTAFQFQR